VDYAHGLTGSAHDASAFEHTAASKHTDWFFKGNEFAWVDSAYSVSNHTIPVHKRPASLIPENALFDSVVAHLQVRSEHCMGALKWHWQCLRGLRVTITSKRHHRVACDWMTVAIILHNLVIEVEGAVQGAHFTGIHTHTEEQEDRGLPDIPPSQVIRNNGELKRQRLVEELLAF
jgi:hypothetical protein